MKKLTVDERRKRIVELARQGKTWGKIGQAVGVPPGMARRIHTRATVALATDLRQLDEVLLIEHDPLAIPLDELGVSSWTRGYLRKAGMTTVGDVVRPTPKALAKLGPVGPTLMREVYMLLARQGIAVEGHEGVAPMPPLPSRGSVPGVLDGQRDGHVASAVT